MGDFLSTLSESNPSSTEESSRPMPPPNSSQPNQSEPEAEPAHQPETPIVESPDPPVPEKAEEKVPEDSTDEGNAGAGGEEEEEEEKGECGFCLFMKEGGCRETFTNWEKCVEEGEKNNEDIVEKCFQVTSALRKCMEEHSDYYAPLLDAEAAAVEQLEAEKEKEKENPADQPTAAEQSENTGEEQKLDDSEKKVTS